MASGRGRRARKAAWTVVSRFGYLQLDTVAIAGARSHTIVLLSRIGGMEPSLGEALLGPGEPLFEYWGHEASWIPIDLYPTFEFRRREFRHHPWWGDVLGEHPVDADRLLKRIRDEGPLRSLDMEGQSGSGWDIKLNKRIASAFWSRGDLAIRERRNFQRTFDLAERVIPQQLRDRPQSFERAIKTLLMRALDGFGWAQTGTLTATWRLRNLRAAVESALMELIDENQIERCDLVTEEGKRFAGWIRSPDLELIPRLDRARPRRDRGVLLSPFDPLLWDRTRVQRLFGFDQVLEIFKPRSQRIYGYYCLTGPGRRSPDRASRSQGRPEIRSNTVTERALRGRLSIGPRSSSFSKRCRSICDEPCDGYPELKRCRRDFTSMSNCCQIVLVLILPIPEVILVGQQFFRVVRRKSFGETVR